MRPCSVALQTFLEGPAKECITIDLYTIVLVTGETFRWAAGNTSLTVASAGFPSISINAGADRIFSRGPGFGRSMLSSKIGVEASSLEITVYSDTALHGDYGIADMVRLGLLEGATVELDRLFAPVPTGPTLDTSMGVLVWFRGRMAEASVGRSVCRLTIKSALDRLSTTQFPRRIYQASCNHVFGDTMCGYDRVAGENALGVATGVGQELITAIVGSSQSEIHSAFVSGITPSPYREGTITCVTGANAGASRTIFEHDGFGTFFFKRQFLSTVTIGDTFNVAPGCNHTTTMCEDVFNNIDRYGGFPWIPIPEAAI